MKGIRRILFPTDFSALSKHAIPHIAGFAERGAREIHLLHAPKRKTEACLEKIEATAAELKKQVLGELTLRTCQVPGIAPGPVIVQYAREHQIDLIILATASKKGFGRLLLGSVAKEVSRQAPCHVLVVREQATAAYKQILVPLDLSKVSQPSLQKAKTLADATGATLHIAHVVEDPASSLFLTARRSLLEGCHESESEVGEAMQELKDEAGCHQAQIHIASGSIYPALKDLIQKRRIDLTVMAAHSEDDDQFGSTSQLILQYGSCSLLILRGLMDSNFADHRSSKVLRRFRKHG